MIYGVAATPNPDQFCAQVAVLLKRARLKQQLSLTRVAEGAGLSRQMVSYVERGLRVPTLDTLFRLSCVLRLDIAELIAEASRRSTSSLP